MWYLAITFLAGSSLQIIPEGTLPSISEEKDIDFFLAGDSRSVDPLYHILYRNSGDPSYRRALVSIKVEASSSYQRVETADKESPQEAAPELNLRLPVNSRKNIVSNGDDLTLWLVSGAIEIELQAKALENGTMMDKIRVKIMETDKELTAAITGPSEVRVEY